MERSLTFWITFLIVFGAFVLLPAFLLYFCTEWSGGFLQAAGCFRSGHFLNEVINMTSGLVFISAFLLFVPVFGYIGAVFWVAAVAGGFAYRLRHQGRK